MSEWQALAVATVCRLEISSEPRSEWEGDNHG